MPGEDFHLSVVAPLQAHLTTAHRAVAGGVDTRIRICVCPCDPWLVRG